jgi:hypothetical protein
MAIWPIFVKVLIVMDFICTENQRTIRRRWSPSMFLWQGNSRYHTDFWKKVDRIPYGDQSITIFYSGKDKITIILQEVNDQLPGKNQKLTTTQVHTNS